MAAQEHQELTSSEDMEALLVGDIVKLKVQYVGNDRDSPECELFAYGGESPLGQKRFIAPRQLVSGKYILMHSAYRENMTLEDGVLVMKEDLSIAGTVTSDDRDYDRFRTIIDWSGLNSQRGEQ